jgi:hypothetical protein
VGLVNEIKFLSRSILCFYEAKDGQSTNIYMGHIDYYLSIAPVVKKYSAFYGSALPSSEVPLIVPPLS